MSSVTQTVDSTPHSAARAKGHHPAQNIAAFEQLLSAQLRVLGADSAPLEATTTLQLPTSVSSEEQISLHDTAEVAKNSRDYPTNSDIPYAMTQTLLAILQVPAAAISVPVPKVKTAHPATEEQGTKNTLASASSSTPQLTTRHTQQGYHSNFAAPATLEATIPTQLPSSATAQGIPLNNGVTLSSPAIVLTDNAPHHTASAAQSVAPNASPSLVTSQVKLGSTHVPAASFATQHKEGGSSAVSPSITAGMTAATSAAVSRQTIAPASFQPVDMRQSVDISRATPVSAVANAPDVMLPEPSVALFGASPSAAVLPASTPQAPAIAAPLGTRAWSEEFVQQVQGLSHNLGTQEVELQLNPPELGPLSVHIKISDQQASAVFSSPHSAVRDAIETSLPKLRDGLANNGITLGNASVNKQPVTEVTDSAIPLPDTVNTRRVVANRTIDLSGQAIVLTDDTTRRTTTTAQGTAAHNAPLRTVIPSLQTFSENHSVTRLAAPNPRATRSATPPSVTTGGIVAAKPELIATKVISASVPGVDVSQLGNDLRPVNIPRAAPVAAVANAPDVMLPEPSVALFGASPSAAVLPASTPQAPAIAAPLGTRAWSEEFVQQVQGLSHNLGTQEVELQLNPPELGPLSVHIKISDQQASAVFSSPHSAVRDAIENSLPKLRDGLANNGITLGNASVNDQTPRDNSGAFFNQRHESPAQAQFNNSQDGLKNLRGKASEPLRVSRHHGKVDTFA